MKRSNSRPAKPLSATITCVAGIGREAAHGSGAESISRRSSCQVGTSLTKASITHEISGPAAFRRLVQPDGCGR